MINMVELDFWTWLSYQFGGFIIALVLGVIVAGILIWLGIHEQAEKEAERAEMAKREEEAKHDTIR